MLRWTRAVRGSGGLRILAAAAGGLAVYAAFAPSTQWWAAILGLGLLGTAVDGTRWRSAFGLGTVFGLTFFLPLLVPLSEKEAGTVLRLVDALEDHDDVQKVYANFNVPDEVMARLSP